MENGWALDEWDAQEDDRGGGGSSAKRVSSPSSLSEKSGCLAFATGVTALAVDIRRRRSAFTLHAAVGLVIPDVAGTTWMCTLF